MRKSVKTSISGIANSEAAPQSKSRPHKKLEKRLISQETSGPAFTRSASRMASEIVRKMRRKRRTTPCLLLRRRENQLVNCVIIEKPLVFIEEKAVIDFVAITD
jgi:hypothetical protein